MPAQWDVVIVGAGPVGATMALLLADHGIPTLVVDRRTRPQTHPAAHVLSTRSLEIWRQLGLEREIRRLSAPIHELRTISYCTTLAGPALGEVPVLDLSAEDVAAVESISPTRAVHLPQNFLEDLMWDRLRDHALVDFRPGWTYVGQCDSATDIFVSLTHADGAHTVATRYLIGADGAGSSVRRELGIGMAGPVLQHMVSVHFAANLERFYRNRRGPVLWTHTPKGLGTFIIHRPPDELVFQIPYFPPIESPDEFTPEVCARHIGNAIGDRSVDIAVKSIQSWAMTAQIADSYQSGATFLVGDAAHRFPPTGGRGLNTGVADAHNLAWKLAWVLSGRADDDLVDTYAIERRPLGRAATDDSVRNFDGLLDVLSALGLPRRPVRALPAALGRVPRWLPPLLVRRIVGLAMALGYQRLRLAAAPGPLGRRVRRRTAAAIALQGPHYRSWGADLGGAYRSGALVPTDSPIPQVEPEFYTPHLHVGGRLPHAWIDDGHRRRSTLDLIRPDCPTVFTTADAAGAWQAVAPPAVAVVGIADSAIWNGLWQLDASDALLLRPDHHVAARLHLDDLAGLHGALMSMRVRSSASADPTRK